MAHFCHEPRHSMTHRPLCHLHTLFSHQNMSRFNCGSTIFTATVTGRSSLLLITFACVILYGLQYTTQPIITKALLSTFSTYSLKIHDSKIRLAMKWNHQQKWTQVPLQSNTVTAATIVLIVVCTTKLHYNWVHLVICDIPKERRLFRIHYCRIADIKL